MPASANPIMVFIIDYIERHKHPANAILHIFGVPMAFYGLFKLITGHIALGIGLLIGGYLLQWLGHSAQGNEVGEITLIKNIAGRLRKKSSGSIGE